MKDDPYFAHFVMLDGNFPSSFRTSSATTAEIACRMLIDAFGADRVSTMSFGEMTLEEFADVIEQWKQVGR